MKSASMAQSVARVLGKDEVIGSNPIRSFRSRGGFIGVVGHNCCQTTAIFIVHIY